MTREATRGSTGARKTRCFLAFTMSREDLEPAVRLLAELRRGVGDRVVKWVAPENLHVTVYFFGDLNRGRLVHAQRVVEAMRGAWSPVPLRWGELGCFPSPRRPGVIWLGMQDGDGELSRLAGWVHARLREHDFPPPDKPFRAHLTLGRVRRGASADWAEVSEAAGGLTPSAQALTIRSMHLFRSVLRPQGPEYSTLVEAPARGGGPPPEGEQEWPRT